MEDEDIIKSVYLQICNRLKEKKQLEETSVAFGNLKSDAERVNFVLNLASIDQIIRIQPSSLQKSTEGSVNARAEGNKLFQKKLLGKALEEYTQSIFLAPGSEKKTTALAYANRSAVLFHLHEYDLCLRDIKAALDNGYPDDSIYKLVDRKGRCLAFLGRKDEAQSAFKEALECLVISNLKSKDKHLWKKQLEKQMNQCCETKQCCSPANPLELIRAGCPKSVEVCHGVNNKYIAASKAFDLAVSPLKGRYPIASQDVQIGDVLLAEKPYASVLLSTHSDSHCHHCFVRILAPLPCSQCVAVRYCSFQCANDSWKAYHFAECKNLKHIHSTGKYGHLALRAVIKTGLCQLRDVVSIAESSVNDPKNLGCNDAGVYDPSDYTPIYHLVGHAEDRVVNDLFQRTVTAVYLLKCIQETSFFDDSQGTQDIDMLPEESIIFVGSMILRHLQSFPCNAHEISELQLSRKSVATSETTEIGAGIYATLSLFNHSCDPNVTRFFYGDKCVLRAMKTIPAGQEIADNYGVLCALTPRDERRKTLANQYYFHCECKACIEDAPLYSEILKIEKPSFKCEGCGSPLTGFKDSVIACKSCNSKLNNESKAKLLKESEDDFTEGASKLLEEADVSSALPQFQRHLHYLETNVGEPWRGFNNCHELMKQCYNILANCNLVD